jgi:hypothetical protein
MNPSPTNTLLALLLALQDLPPATLTPAEQAKLRKIGLQLALPKTDWDFTWENFLMPLINSNPALKSFYEQAINRLEALDPSTLPSLLPTLKQLEREILADNYSPFVARTDFPSDTQPDVETGDYVPKTDFPFDTKPDV